MYQVIVFYCNILVLDVYYKCLFLFYLYLIVIWFFKCQIYVIELFYICIITVFSCNIHIIYLFYSYHIIVFMKIHLIYIFL